VIKIAAIAAMVFATCAFAPPDGTEGFTPPERYREIWQEAQACTGLSGDFDRVAWYVVPGNNWPCDEKGKCIGQWRQPHTILIAEAWQNIDWVVKHEMIHDLTGLSHDGGERDKQIWGRQCHAMWGWLDTDPTYRP
jgi:hypothetical protein